MLRRLSLRNKEKDFQPSTSKNISTLRVKNIINWQTDSTRLGMLRRLYPCVIKKGFPTIHQQEYFDPKGRKISSTGRLTRLDWDAA
jgi:hypothetical protein